MTIAAAARSSIADCADAAVREKCWRPRGSTFRPPTRIDAPRTSRTLPMIEPISEALTTSCSPFCSAKRAMISSGALPNVTFSSPPMPGPERADNSSVARPISAAVGMIPMAEVKKITPAVVPAMSSTIAAGMNGTSRYGQPWLDRRKRVTAAGLAAQQVRALLDLRDVVLGLGQAVEVLLRGAAGARGGRRDRGGGRRRGRRRRRGTTRGARQGTAERARQLRERPRVRGLGDRLRLVEVLDRQVEDDLAALQPVRLGLQGGGDGDVELE